MKRQKIVLIEWNDTGVVHGWVCGDHAPENNFGHCQSVGFLTRDDMNSITIAFAVSDQGLVMELKTIPRGCITAIKALRVK